MSDVITTENGVAVPEYTQLVGTGRAGDFVLETQGGSADKGFKNVSQYWLPKTITFDQAIEKLEKERANRQDIVGLWSDWTFKPGRNTVMVEYKDGRQFVPTEFALGHLAEWSSIKPYHVLSTLSKDFEPDEMDIQQLCDTMNYRKERKHQTNKNEDRELMFRTYSDNTLRAVLTTGYAVIDNRWFLEVLRDLIPGGHLSHQRGDADTMYANILIPDSCRFDTDSDYGGLFAVRNSEIGKASLDTKPSLFRAICQNGCIWDETAGINFRQVHKGEIKLDGLAVRIGENLDKQIKLIPEIMEKFLALRQYEFNEVGMEGVFAAVSERFKMSALHIKSVIEEFIEHESDNMNAFGIVNSITRAGQLFDAETTEKFDTFAGQLVQSDWNKLSARAKSYTDKEIIKLLGV